jgi:hypothetical protein
MQPFSLVKALALFWAFLFVLIKSSYSQTVYEQIDPLQKNVISKCKFVSENRQTIDHLSPNDLADLPVGIARETPAGTFVIAIDSAYSNEQGWFFSAYAAITFPGTSRPLAFAAQNIGFNQGGLSGSSQVRLVLVSSHSISISDELKIELPADGHNYIEWDCHGFKSVNLKGDFIFSDKLLTPDIEVANGTQNVKASFEINTADLSNVMVAVNLTPFKIKGLDDLSFQVKNAVADFSDLVNPSGYIFPKEYQEVYNDNIQLWRGFYLQEVDVRFKGLSQPEKKDLIVSARNLLIDEAGVTGAFAIQNALPLDAGSADGWPFSIDQLSVKLMFNKLQGGSLNGKIVVPFLGEEPIDYSAQVVQLDNQLNYMFAVNTGKDRYFNTPFSAQILLDKSSIISIERREGKLIPSTLLNGHIIVNNGLIEVKKLRFEQLGLTTQKPYIKSGIFSTVGDDESRSVGFPLSIQSVKLSVFEGKAAIGFDVSLNMMNKDDKGFSATTFIQILASMEEKQSFSSGAEGQPIAKKEQKWKFEKVKVNDIKLSAKTTAMDLNGQLSIFDDDPIYGNGFRGSLGFSVKKILPNEIKVNAYFGSKHTFRYWHVDAYVPATLPLVPPLDITGFMGGASYHMVRQGTFNPDFTKLGIATASNTDTTSYQPDRYLPDEKASMSLLAGVTLEVARPNAVNADAILEVTFNNTGGIRYAQFTGSAFFFTPPEGRERLGAGNSNPTAPVYAKLDLKFDNANNAFHANLGTYINVAGVVKGTGPNGLVGEAVIHIDPKEWYLYIGRPSQMFGLDVSGLAVARTYFMVGNKIEPIPPPPTEVREIFDDIDDNIMRDDASAARGRGFALGAHFRVGYDTKDKIRPFYAVMNIGAGTDVMLRDFGDAVCKGRSGTIGVDGWYASGQAYVFLTGKVGIRVKRRDFDFLYLGAAALLQAKLPNPTWLRGQLGGKYRVLGGLVKGKFNVKFIVGEECEIINPGGELDDIKVIEDLKPDLNATDVSVFAAPQVSFNTSIETDFTMMDLQDNINSYRIRLEEFSLKKGNSVIPATLEWNSAKDVAVLRTAEILPPQSTLTIIVKVYWEQKAKSGAWEKIKENGQVSYELKETTFTTGIAPDFIPEENIAYSYPAKDQYNFHVHEYGTGYMKLKVGQSYLFPASADGIQWTYVAKFEDLSRKSMEVPLTYHASEAQVTFNIPQELSLQSIYRLYFLKRPASQTAVDANLVRANVAVTDGDNEMSLTSNSLDGTITQSVDKEVYKSAFRTSKYRKFEDKWNALGSMTDVFDIATGNIAVIGKRGVAEETFDEFELFGRTGSSPLIQSVASTENGWLKNKVAPVLYNDYPIDKAVTLSWRDPNELGLKPVKGVRLTNSIENYTLLESDISANLSPSKGGNVTVNYFLSYYTFWDMNDLQNKAAAIYLNNWLSAPAAAKRLIAWNFNDLERGDYQVKIAYILPGINQTTFSKDVSIKF